MDTPDNVHTDERIRRWSHYLSIHTLQGRMLIFVIIFICLLSAFSVVVLLQNRKGNYLMDQLESSDTRKLIYLAEMMSGVDEVSSLQQLYFLGAGEKYVALAETAWEEKIDYPLRQLDSLQENYEEDAFLTEKMPLLKSYLRDYKSALKQAKLMYTQQSKAITGDSLVDTAESFQQFVDDHRIVPAQMSKQYAREVIPENDKLKALLMVLLEEDDQVTLDHVNDLQNLTEWTNVFTMYVMILSILFSVGFAFFNSYKLSESIDKPTNLLRKLSRGEIPEQMASADDELSDVVEASNLLSINLRNASLFAKSIGDGKFDFAFNPISEADVLGNSLVQMRKRLQEVSEEDRKRNWVTQGLAKFADIVRSNNEGIKSLGETTLIALIEYLGANQGGMFVAKPGDDDTHAYLEMIACYAYDRKKYVNKRIKVDFEHADTLLGQVYLEKEKVYLKQIPDGYLNISSGLGEASAEFLLVMPLKLDDTVEGVMEIASLHPFDDYQIGFIEKICESITSSIASVNTNEHTKTLVRELQQQTELMRVQEEEMRENMEELTITQEEMRSKQLELEQLKNNLESEIGKRTQELRTTINRFDLMLNSSSEGLWDVTFSQKGTIDLDTSFSWSDNLIRTLNFTREEFPDVMRSWTDRIHPEDRDQVIQAFFAHIHDLSGNTSFQYEHRIQLKTGTYRWFLASSQVVRDQDGYALRAAGFINDINDQKELHRVLEELNAKGEALEASNKMLQSNTEILEKALKKTRVKEIELKKSNVQLVSNEERLANITKNVPGIIFQFEYQVHSSTGHFIYVSDYVQTLLAYSPEEFLQFDTQKLFDQIHEEDREEYSRVTLESIKTLNGLVWEGRIKDKHGTWKWVRISSTPRIQGEAHIFEGIFQDIHQSKLQEEEFKKMTTELLIREEELRRNYQELANFQKQESEKNTN